jgi:hypothetical protein
VSCVLIDQHEFLAQIVKKVGLKQRAREREAFDGR